VSSVSPVSSRHPCQPSTPTRRPGAETDEADTLKATPGTDDATRLGFYTCFLGRPEIVDVGGLGGPGGPKQHSERWGASPPIFWIGVLGPPGPPRPPTSAISGRPKHHV
jgi:hypothetical protein